MSHFWPLVNAIGGKRRKKKLEKDFIRTTCLLYGYVFVVG